MKKPLKVYDTSALLNLKDELKLDEHSYIPILVLKELENIKTSTYKDDEVKFYARKVVNALHECDVMTTIVPRSKIDKLMKKYADALEDNNDSRILLEAKVLSEDYDITFFTGDRCQYLLFHKLFPALTVSYIEDISQERIDDGYRYIQPTDEEWVKLYDPECKDNIFQAYINEYIFLQDSDGSVKEIVRWDGEEYVRLGYEPIDTLYYGRVEPRSLEQKCYLDALQNPSISIVSTVATPGTGKTYIALLQGLAALERGEYRKIVYIRNNFEVAQTKEIGFLEGSLQKKTSWLLGPITSIVGSDYLDGLIAEEKFEYVHLSFIRGLTIGPDCFVIVDEAQNLTKSLIKTIISRIGEGTKIVFCSDFAQRDSQLFIRSSGVMAMSRALTGDPNFAQVRLKKVERSKVCMLAEKI